MGLFDRQYMRGGNGGKGNGPRYFHRSGMDMIYKLIAVNVIVFLAVMFYPPLARYLILTSEGIKRLELHPLLTAAFLHLDFWHILFNMWGLYLFGRLVAIHLPQWKVLLIYLIGGIAGNVLFVIFNFHTHYALLGASGAVFALTMGAAMLEPNQRFVLIFMPFWPLKTSTMVICYTVLEVLMEFSRPGDGIAHLAHLGGFLGGYAAVKLLYPGRTAWDPFRMLMGRQPGSGGGPGPGRFRGTEYRPGFSEPVRFPSVSGGNPVTQKELDYLLDKIASGGINSLSEDELARLRLAREQMKKS